METGAAFGPWLLDKQLGVGGMGEVWLATHRVLGTQIAVKILAPELTRDPRFRERFISEAKVQARLSHPHIAHIQDFLEENGRFAILMELIPGGTVADAIDRAGGPLPIEQTLKWAKQALEALDFAHRHGVIHRDVKPANLMLDGAGDIKVTDFGIAIALGAGRMTTTGKSVGTPQYMSPEQIMRPQSVDHRTDVYSMGVVLYEMLAGRVPFDADTDYTLQRLHIEARPPSLRNLNPLVPEWLESVVLQCLAKSPDDRLAGCAAVAEALSWHPLPTVPVADRHAEKGAHAPTELAEPGKGAVEKPAIRHPDERPQLKLKSRPRRWVALAISGFAVIALLLVWWWVRIKPQNVAGGPPKTLPSDSSAWDHPPAGLPSAAVPVGETPPSFVPDPGGWQNVPAGVTKKVSPKGTRAQAPAIPPGFEIEAVPSAAPTDREVSTLRNSVAAAARARDWSKAGSLIDGLLARFPTNAEALEWRKLLSEGRKSDLAAKLNPKQAEPDGFVPDKPAIPPAERPISAPPTAPSLDLDEIAKRAGAAYTRQDYATAAPLYQQLADSGRADAMVWLASMYAKGLGLDQSDSQAVAWYRKAADNGNPTAMNDLAGLYLSGRGVARDDAQAAAWYRKAAEKGEPVAMNNLGAMYRDGRGVAQDDTQAAAWFRKAAENGNPNGMNNLGGVYESGRGAAQDAAQAVYWFQKAAENGNAAGMCNLGRGYSSGRGVVRDDAQAAAWYRKAAEKGEPVAMTNLGWAYANGRGVERDDAQAVSWYRKAAGNGNPSGMNNLGAMYRDGRGVAQDDAQAVAWFQKAAEKGNAAGMTNLAWMYEHGRGVVKDIAEALAQYGKAAALGNENAKASLKRLGH